VPVLLREEHAWDSGRVAGIDWAQALDIPQARKNVESEFYGDWYNDPWGWPELAFLTKYGASEITEHLNGSSTRQSALLDVPKANWGYRPAVVVDPLDRLVYQALVDRLSLDLIGELPPSVYGWRLPAVGPQRGQYSHNDLQWDAYRSHLGAASGLLEAALTTDVVSCFASIDVDRVSEAVAERCKKGAPVNRLLLMLQSFDANTPERTGLVQRSTASAVLANMFMSVLDDVMDAYAVDLPSIVLPTRGVTPRRKAKRSWLRWMDDMWLFGTDASTMRRAQIELQSAARSIGLQLNSAKTEVYEGNDVFVHAMNIEHSAVDGALEANSKDEKPLEEMIDRILSDPEKASRTTVKFAINRMLKHGVRYRQLEFVKASPRMPHCADSLAKLFSHRFTQASLGEWFMSQTSSDWLQFEWSTSFYILMLDSNTKPVRGVLDYAAHHVEDANISVQLLSACAQRLVAWDRTLARTAIRAGMARAANPQHRRILALASLSAGESGRQVGTWLRQQHENDLTQKMLAREHHAPPPVLGSYASAK
jgi:hypothetical protein